MLPSIGHRWVSLPPHEQDQIQVRPHVKATGPSFAPSGSSYPNFRCEYPTITEWEPCSLFSNRKCWLRNRIDGRQFDIFTDYENLRPAGIPRYYNLTLTDEEWDADSELFPFAKLFNKQYPGPLIEACWGDELHVTVTNKLHHNGTTIHWHGIRQLFSMQMDGVNAVTQYPLAPLDTMTYSFNITQYGSSWYHSHYSVQYADGAAGPMTLHGPSSDDYDDAVPALIMSDWGHNSAFKAILPDNSLLYPDILLNGFGDIRKWSVQNTTEVKPSYTLYFEEVPSDEPVKRYLIRIIYTSFQTTFIFSIDNHMLEIISTDFVLIVPCRNTTVLSGISQRYDLIVEARPQLDPNNHASTIPNDMNFWIRTTTSTCNSDLSAPHGHPEYDKIGIVYFIVL